MAGYLKKESKILCICEMQWWEKALYAYARRRGITTVGLQHTIVPELLLNYFNDPREMTGLDFLKYCPLPDYLATVGRISSEMFRRGGWPSQRVFVWGSPRFESLKAVTESPVPWADKGNYFVAAFSVNIEEIEKFLCLLKDAFSQARGYKVMIKSHPAEDLKSHVRRMGLELDPSVFEFTSEPLGKIIRKAKGFIGTISSSCLYALACDIPVMVPRFAGLIDCSPLSYISDIPLYIYTPDQLRSACEDILRSAEPPCSGGKNRRFLEDYLYFPKDEGEYLEKIESI
jgi:surface carbohydrate biosynthesis protein (TIGR04326 family)